MISYDQNLQRTLMVRLCLSTSVLTVLRAQQKNSVCIQKPKKTSVRRLMMTNNLLV